MEISVPTSFCFLHTAVMIKPNSAENPDPEKEALNTVPEIYARFVLCKQVDHENLCKYISLESISDKELAVISEAYLWTLDKVISSRAIKRQGFSEDEVGEVIMGLLKGLNKVLSLGVPYLDLSPANVMIAADGVVKLAHPLDYFLFSGCKKNPDYEAPELKNGTLYCFKSDCWSLGIIALEMLRLSKTPKETEEDLNEFLCLDNLNIGNDLKDLLGKVLQKDPTSRFDVIDALQHPYFFNKTSIKSQKILVKHIYFLWKKRKNFENHEKLKNFLIGNNSGFSQFQRYQKQDFQVLISRSFILLEGLAQDFKREQDSESYTGETKLQSEQLSGKAGSFIGKIGGFFVSKSVKSSDSGSGSVLKQTDLFSDWISKYKYYLRHCQGYSEEYIEVNNEGFPSSLRPDLWKRLLSFPPGYTQIYSFLRQCRKTEINKQISLDIPRCHKNNLFLTSSLGKSRLDAILKLWVSKNDGIKYSQGLDSIAAICILINEDDEAAGYFSFSNIVGKYLLPVLIHEDLVGNFLLVLRNLVSFLDPVLSSHLHSNNISPEMYATSWLLTIYSHSFPISSVLVIWDFLLQKPPEFIFILAYSILQQFREQLLGNSQNEIISFLSDINSKIDIEKCIKDSIEYSEVIPSGICRIAYPGPALPEWEKELPFEVACATRSALISMKECEKIKGEYLIVDTRSVEEYSKFMITGSVNLPLKTGNIQGVLPSIKLTQAQLQSLKEHSKGKTVILIGDASLAANSLANILVKQNVPKVCILRGGIRAVKGNS